MLFKTTIILFSFVVVLLCFFTFWVPCCDVRYEFSIKRCSVRLYLQLFVGGRDNVVFMFFVVVSTVFNTLFCVCVFVLFVFVFCTPYMLPVFRCSFLIATSIFFVYSFTGVRNKMRHKGVAFFRHVAPMFFPT
jgi:hypothetical protein